MQECEGCGDDYEERFLNLFKPMSQIDSKWEMECQVTDSAEYCIRAMAALAFDRLGTHRLFARLDVENTGPVRLCERLGMRREAHLVENVIRTESSWGTEYIYVALTHELSGRGRR
jgi:hypothetical protein